MARGIEARLAVEAPEPEPRRGMPAWTWQLGAAAACAMVAVAVLNVGPKAEKEYAPAAEQVVAQQAFPEEDKDMIAESREVKTLPAPMEAEPAPLLEKKKESAEPAMLALADRSDERFATDAAAPPPPPAAKAVSVEAGANSLLAQEGRARRAFAVGGRMAAPAQANVLGLAEGLSGEPMFGVRPLPAAGESVQMGADGWISVSADGAMTITEVYDAQ